MNIKNYLQRLWKCRFPDPISRNSDLWSGMGPKNLNVFNNFSVQVDLRPHFEKHWSSFNRSDVTRSFQCWLEPPAMVSSPAHKAAPSHFSKFSLVPNTSQSLPPLSSDSFLWSYTEKSNISPIMMTLYICFYFIILSVFFFFFIFWPCLGHVRS